MNLNKPTDLEVGVSKGPRIGQNTTKTNLSSLAVISFPPAQTVKTWGRNKAAHLSKRIGHETCGLPLQARCFAD